jgi:galactokinase
MVLNNLKNCVQKNDSADQQEIIVVRAPGRANIIGEHTDYNYGLVMPIAIDRDVIVAGTPQKSNIIRLNSLDFKDEVSFDINDIKYESEHTWANYAKGVIKTLMEKGVEIPSGFSASIHGNVPIGAGMSSSAAIEVATATFLEEAFNLSLHPKDVALWCVEAENDFVGVNCGIMDQFASKLSKKDHALFIDCRDYSYQYIPFHINGYKVLLINSKVKRALFSTEYNIRRAECEKAVSILKSLYPDIESLRDVTINHLKDSKGRLDKRLFKRARHVINENERVITARKALEKDDLPKLGNLLVQSHESLRDDYEVSCPELDFLVETALSIRGVLGGRMMGGGFGGSTINIVKEDCLENITGEIQSNYKKRFDLTPEFYICDAADGAKRI